MVKNSLACPLITAAGQRVGALFLAHRHFQPDDLVPRKGTAKQFFLALYTEPEESGCTVALIGVCFQLRAAPYVVVFLEMNFITAKEWIAR